MWHHYIDGVHAIIFVVDASDINRILEAKKEISKLANIQILKYIPLLVYANKQDLTTSLNPSYIAQKLELNVILPKSSDWRIQGTDALSGSGLFEGLDWLCDILNANQKC